MDKGKFGDDSPMPFGMHKGVKMANVPPEYLIWLLENNKCSGAVKNYIEQNKSVLLAEIKRAKK